MKKIIERISFLIKWIFGKTIDKHKKCNCCNFKSISKITWHDLFMNKCSECGFIRLKNNDMMKLYRNIIILNNIGDIKRLKNITDMKPKYKRIVQKIFEIHSKHTTTIKNCENTCECCGSQLKKIVCLNEFEYYYCDYCNAFYFLQKDFDEVIKNYVEK